MLRLVKKIVRTHCGGVKLLGVGEDPLFSLKLRIFLFAADSGLGDLFGLVPPQIGHAQAVLLVGEHLVQPRLRGAPLCERRGNSLQRQAAEAVQQHPLLRLVKGSQRLSLRVHECKFRCEQPKYPHRRGLIVYEYPTLAIGDDLPSQHDGFGIGIGVNSVTFKHGQRARSRLEDTANNRLLCAVAYEIRRGLASQQQRQGVNQDRLSRSGLTRKQVQTTAKSRFRPIDHRIVLCAQLQQHLRFASPSLWQSVARSR